MIITWNITFPEQVGTFNLGTADSLDDGTSFGLPSISGDAVLGLAETAGDNGGTFTVFAADEVSDGEVIFNTGTDFTGLTIGSTTDTSITVNTENGSTAILTITVEAFRTAAAPSASGTVTISEAPNPKTIYVDFAAGSDTNTGEDIGSPRKTAPSGGVLAPGSKVIFKGGVSYERGLNIQDTGNTTNRIEYLSNPDGTFGTGAAILDGSVQITGFGAAETVGGQTVYRAALTAKQTENFVLEGWNPASQAQLPLPPADRMLFNQISTWATPDSTYSTNGTNLFIEDPTMFQNLSDAGASLVSDCLVKIHVSGNARRTHEIIGYDSGTGTVELNPTPLFENRKDFIGGQARYALVNHVDGLAADGTYLIDSATDEVIYRPFGDVDVSTVTVRIASRGTAVNLTGSHITLDGFDIRGFRSRGILGEVNTTRNYVRNNEIHLSNFDANSSDCAIIFETPIECRAEGNHVHETAAGRGIMMNNGRDTVFKGNRSERTSRTCMTVYGGQRHAVIDNDIGVPLTPHGNGLSCYLDHVDLEVSFNRFDLFGSGQAAFTMQDTTRTTLVFNEMFASGSDRTMAHWPSSSNGNGEFGETFMANNTVMSETFDLAAKIDQGESWFNSTYINNILDGISIREEGVNGLHRFGNVMTRHDPESSKDITVSEFEAWGDIDGRADRATIFPNIGTGGDLTLAASGSLPGYLTTGAESWSYEGVTIDFIGARDPATGAYPVDPATLYMEPA